MAVTREILNSYSQDRLKEEIAKTNIEGYKSLKKPELIELMMKYKERFGHLKMNEKKRRTQTEEEKQKRRNQARKKREDEAIKNAPPGTQFLGFSGTKPIYSTIDQKEEQFDIEKFIDETMKKEGLTLEDEPPSAPQTGSKSFKPSTATSIDEDSEDDSEYEEEVKVKRIKLPNGTSVLVETLDNNPFDGSRVYSDDGENEEIGQWDNDKKNVLYYD